LGLRLSRISMSLPSDLLHDFDSVVHRLGYGDRSKALQVAMRNFVTEFRSGVAEGTGVGVLTLMYDHDVLGVEESLTDTQHKYRSVISSTFHIHLDERRCLEIVGVKGTISTIKSLAKELMTSKGVRQFKETIIAL